MSTIRLHQTTSLRVVEIRYGKLVSAGDCACLSVLVLPETEVRGGQRE